MKNVNSLVPDMPDMFWDVIEHCKWKGDVVHYEPNECFSYVFPFADKTDEIDETVTN